MIYIYMYVFFFFYDGLSLVDFLLFFGHDIYEEMKYNR